MKLIAPVQINDVPVEVPTSKSISNRLLIIQAISGKGNIQELSDAHDTIVLQKMLRHMPAILDVGHAGTAFRFLVAYLSIQVGEFILTGSSKMKTRPIAPLVDALRELGADIQYLENDGYPPLKITGKNLEGGNVKVRANISSQYISALMLIGPALKNGLHIELMGEVVSKPYIEMTASLMHQAKVNIEVALDHIKVKPGSYNSNSIQVEKDWSAIAFWYALVLIGKWKHLLIKDVHSQSIQGDKAVIVMFKALGVNSAFDDKGLHLGYNSQSKASVPQVLNLQNTPDLVQPMVVSLAATQRCIKITGISTLKHKESNRGEALKIELLKFGSELEVGDDNIRIIKPVSRSIMKTQIVATYEDHRMAMAFAPMALRYGSVVIENPEVVGKSYPEFWVQLKKRGFTVESIA